MNGEAWVEIARNTEERIQGFYASKP